MEAVLKPQDHNRRGKHGAPYGRGVRLLENSRGPEIQAKKTYHTLMFIVCLFVYWLLGGTFVIGRLEKELTLFACRKCWRFITLLRRRPIGFSAQGPRDTAHQ